jgi:hypothetical protein
MLVDLLHPMVEAFDLEHFEVSRGEAESRQSRFNPYRTEVIRRSILTRMKPRVSPAPMGFFPVAAVEEVNLKFRNIHAVEASDIYIDLIRIRTRYIERRYPANRAEVMLGGLGVEVIDGEIRLRRQQVEALALDDPVKVGLLGADRAIALACRGEFAVDFESDLAAVTSAPVGHPLAAYRNFATAGNTTPFCRRREKPAAAGMGLVKRECLNFRSRLA